MPSFIRDTLSVAVSKILIIGLGLTKAIIIARYLGPESNGVIAALAVYPSLFMSIGSLGIRQSTVFFVGSGKFQLADVKAAVVQIWWGSTVLSVLCSYFLVRHLSSGGDRLGLVLLAISPIPFVLFNTYNTGVFLGQNKIKQFNRINWLPNLFVTVATAALVVWVPLGLYGALAAAIFGPLVMFVVLIVKNRFLQSIHAGFNWTLIRSMLALGSIYALALLILNLNYKADIIFLDHLASPHEVGIYSKGAHLIEYLWQIPMLFSTVVFARSATARDKAAFSVKVCQLLRVSLIAVGTLAAGLAILSNWIIVGLFGEAFAHSGTVLQILLPGVVLLTILKVVNMDLAGRGKPWLSIIAMLPALLVNAVLNVLLIPRYGANGAAFASTVSYSFGGVLTLLLYARETKQSIASVMRIRFDDFAFLASSGRAIFR